MYNKIMHENVVKLDYKGKEIYLVKTAHVSKNSVEDVKGAMMKAVKIESG